MRTKLWSTLLAFVLLCACVAGVLVFGAQAADGKTYEWVVNGEATDTTSNDPNEWTFVSIDKAIQYAKSQTAFTWGADDELIVHIAAKNTAEATATTRLLFNTATVFRADHTLLPITIDGDDPSTVAVERNGFNLNGNGFYNPNESNKYYGVACGNSYYFKGMDLNWGASAINFRSGCGQVTFDGVTFGGTSMLFSADGTSSAVFPGWKADNFNAMKNEDGKYEITLTLKNLTYAASATNAVSARNWSSGFTVSAASFGVGDTRSKLVIGEGATVTNVSIAAATITEGVASDAYCLSVEGGTVTSVYGVRASSNVYGDIITEISSGTVTNFCPGSNTGTLNGNVTNTVTGGSVTGKYRGGSISTGTINGNVTNYIYGGTLTECHFGSEEGVINGDVTNYLGKKDKSATFTSGGFAGGNHGGGAINGDITNYYYSVKFTGSFYGGPRMGLAENVINNFYDGFNGSSVVNSYCGGNSAANGGAIKYTITNNIYGGQFGSHFYCGSASTAWAALGENETAPEYRIINNVSGGSFYRLYCSGNGVDITDGKVKNTFTGDISVAVAICGGYTVPERTISAIENTFAANFTGKGTVYGGSLDGTVGTVENTYTGGSFTNTTYGGSDKGTVKSITNTVTGGTFDGTYFVCGNNKATFAAANGDSTETVRINNNITAGTFKRIVGGSYNADVNGSIQSVYDTAIVATTAVYAGNASGGSITGTVNNTVNGSVTDQKATIKVFYGGNNNGGGTIGAIVNTVNGGQLRAFYGGCNYEGKPVSITNTVNGGVFGCDFFQELEDDSAVYFCGGNRVADLACNVTSTLKAGTFVNIYAGTLLGNDSGEVKLALLPEGKNLTVLGKAYGITSSFSKAANPICIGRDTYLCFAVSDPENYVYVLQTEGWDFDCYVSIPGDQNDIAYSQAEGVAPGAVYVDYLSDRVILRCGNAGVVESASLVLTDRIAIKVYFAKGRVFEGFTYSFTDLSGTVLASGTESDLMEEGDYYYTILPAIGLSEFDKPFLLSGNYLRTIEMSVEGLADQGAAYYSGKDAKAEKLFQSIADLSRVANGGKASYGLTPESVAYTPTAGAVRENREVLDVNSVTLMMSNAVGLSFRGVAAAPDTVINVYADGQKVTDFCGITVSEEKNATETYDVSVDLYLNVAAMSREIKIELVNADGSASYLTVYTRADYLAHLIAGQPEAKKAAQDLLSYIQAVDAYIA